MPKKAIDYSKCMFYRLVCRDITVTEVYVGHTTNEVDRRRCHKKHCTNEKDEKYNFFVYRFIRDHGGFENWQLIIHEKLPVKDKDDARLRERYWCEHYNSTLNTQVPGRTMSEYAAKYHVEHREEINNKTAARYFANSDHLKQKHTCVCGGKYTTQTRCQHLKTKKHLASL